MVDPRESRKAFTALVALPDDAIDLGHASLLIAREEYPDLDVGRYLSRLDEMAADIGRRLKGGEGARSRVAHLNRLLFEEMGFHGNREEYKYSVTEPGKGQYALFMHVGKDRAWEVTVPIRPRALLLA
ncbi:MAG: transglutaminase family protein, partial [Acidobacteriota bacterium]